MTAGTVTYKYYKNSTNVKNCCTYDITTLVTDTEWRRGHRRWGGSAFPAPRWMDGTQARVRGQGRRDSGGVRPFRGALVGRAQRRSSHLLPAAGDDQALVGGRAQAPTARRGAQVTLVGVAFLCLLRVSSFLYSFCEACIEACVFPRPLHVSIRRSRPLVVPSGVSTDRTGLFPEFPPFSLSFPLAGLVVLRACVSADIYGERERSPAISTIRNPVDGFHLENGLYPLYGWMFACFVCVGGGGGSLTLRAVASEASRAMDRTEASMI